MYNHMAGRKPAHVIATPIAKGLMTTAFANLESSCVRYHTSEHDGHALVKKIKSIRMHHVVWELCVMEKKR